MIMFILQTLVLIAIAFVIGAVVGCWLKSSIGTSADADAPVVPPAQEPAAADETVSIAPVQDVAPAAAIAPAAMPEVQSIAQTDDAPEPSPRKSAKKSTKSASPPSRKAAAKPSAAAKKTRKTASLKQKTATDAAEAGGPDDLKKIKGIGRVIEGKLNAEGITRYAQIAAWTKKDAAAFSEKLDFQGRIEREDWIAQAKVLAKGGSTAFSKRVGRGEVKSSS